MKNKILGMLTLCIIAACGGGDIKEREHPMTTLDNGLPAESDVKAFFAGVGYTQFFPGVGASGIEKLEPYLYRYYPATGNYLGLDGNIVRVLGPISGDQLLTVGYIRKFSGYNTAFDDVIPGYEECNVKLKPAIPTQNHPDTEFRFCLRISENQPTDFSPVSKARQ